MKKEMNSGKWIFKKVRPYFPGLIVLIIVGIIVSYITVRFSLISKKLIDIVTNQAEGSVLYNGIWLALMLIAQLILQIVYIRIHIKISGRLSMSIRTDLFHKLLKKDFAEVSSIHSGEFLNRLISDVSIVSEKVTEIIPNLFTLLSTVVFSFSALYVLDKHFAIACLFLGPVALAATYIYKKKIKTLHIKCRESDGKVRSFIQETIQNFLVVKAFGRESYMSRKAYSLQTDNYKLNVKRSTAGIMANILFFLAVTMVYYGALAWSVYRLSLGLITFGTVTAVLSLVSQLQSPFREVAGILPQTYMVLASAERLIELENIKEETQYIETNRDLSQFSKISFHNVSFSYDETEVLKNVSLDIKKGEFVALCGISGAGKSTMTKLLLSVLVPNEGNVLLKFEDGESINFNSDMRKMFSYVPQGNMILSGTIRDNITFADEAPDEEKLKKVIEIAQIKDFIDKTPKGLDTYLGEKGHGLSEGQVQRIAIARALYYDAPVLLLDEATSSLDIATESHLLSSIKELTDKTCIIISHRREVIDACDKTFILQNGALNAL